MEGARPARIEDLDEVTTLARAAIDELEPMRGGVLWRQQVGRREPVATGLAADLARPDDQGLVVVGTLDDVVVGYGVTTLETLADGSTLAVISDLFVSPQARGVGIGEALMALLVGHAQDHGAVGIDSIALPGDRATKNFFETFGLKARAIVVHRPLGAPVPVGGEAGAGS